MAGKPETKQSASCSERHLAMMGAQEIVAQFVDLAKTIGTYVGDPARFIELELAFASNTISPEDRDELAGLRNELVGWNRWSADGAPPASLIDLADVLDEENLGITKRAVVLMDYTCHVLEDLDYALVAERVDDKIVITRCPMPEEGDPQPSTEVEYDDLTEEQFAELSEDASFQDRAYDEASHHMRFWSYEELLATLDRADLARRMWDQRSGADVDGLTWPMFGPMFGPMPASRTRIERDLLAIDPKLTNPSVVHAAGGIRAVPLGQLVDYALLYGALSARQAQFIHHQDSRPGGNNAWNRSID
jgi:hypothetical protein